MTACLEGRPEIAQQVLQTMRLEVEEKGWKLSITEGGKEGPSNVIATCSSLEEMFQECSKKRGVGLATCVETCGVDSRTTTKQLATKEKARRRACDVRFSVARRKQFFPKELHEDWREEVAEDWFWSLRQCGEAKPLASHLQKGLRQQMTAAAGKKE